MSYRIKCVRTTPVNIPLEAPFHWSPGLYPGFSKVVIEVESESGAVGIGEAPSHALDAIIRDGLAPKLIGADPRDLADCERRCLPPLEIAANVEDLSLVRAYGAVELALWDLVGKLEGRSLAALLGGRVRDTAAFSEYFAFRVPTKAHRGEQTPLDVARYCARMREEHGSTLFEGKVGALAPEIEIEMVREIRAAIGDDGSIRLDANRGWSLTQAREMLFRLEPYGIRSIEEPTRSPSDLAKLRPSTSIGFSSHDTSLSPVLSSGVPDAFVINLTALGGIRRTLRFIAACEHLGVDVWFYSPDTGIAHAAYLQVVGAVSWLSQPSQTLIRWHSDDVIAESIPQPRDGVVAIPDAPGLGVSLDVDALKRCHRRFLEQGPYNPYATARHG